MKSGLVASGPERHFGGAPDRRVFAPIHRQGTLTALLSILGGTPTPFDTAIADACCTGCGGSPRAACVVAHFSKSLEETLEALGTTLLWLAMLRHLMRRTEEVRMRFDQVSA